MTLKTQGRTLASVSRAISRRRIRRIRRGRDREAGSALLELALSLPLFLVVICGLTAVVGLAQARFELAVLTRAAVREVAMGNTSPAFLNPLVNAYAGRRDAAAADRYVVLVGDDGAGASFGEWLMTGTRVAVRRRVAVPRGVTAFLPPAVVMEDRAVVLTDTWKHPWSRLARLLGLA